MRAILSIFILCSFSALFGQQVSTTWPLTDPNTGGTGMSPVISGNLNAGDEMLNNMEINQYTGLNNCQRLRIAGNAWPANQSTQIDTVFTQFSVSPQNGFKLTVDSIALNMIEISINTMKANVYYSTDSTFTTSTRIDYVTGDTSSNHYLDRDTFTTVRAGINQVLNPGEKIYLRVYPWVEDPTVRTGKYFGLQDVKISGLIESLPVASSAMWPLTDPDAGGTGLSAVVTGGAKAEDEALINTEINHYTGPNNSQRVRIAGNAWPANQTTQIDTVYIQFQASPKFGGTFNVDSISLGIAAISINTMKANIYYSSDSNFASPTQINYTTGDTSNYLITDSLLYVGTSLSTTINTGESIYLRVYPWVDNDPAVRTGKYFAIQNVLISGTTIGVTADPPTVTTTAPTFVSTTFATGGGNISTDGGASVTARGVVWNTAGMPTISDSKTEDGIGVGSFVSNVTGLTPGETYSLRAYATNDAGTAYGDEVTFTTLDSTTVPMVTTTVPSSILTKTAESGGTVTAWGGDTVIVRGICWNDTGNPIVTDYKTENGSGLGSFKSILYDLTPNTTYYVRAYATNSIGAGYGEVDTFKTQSPAPAVTKIVAADGSGDYTTVQAAFDGVPDSYTGPYTVFVKKGTYKEKLLLGSKKVNVILMGEDRDSTVLTYDDYAGIAGGTSGSYSVGIDAADFTAMNITFQNTVKNDQSVSSQQAVALRSNGDRQAFYNCNLLGYQDTYYAWGGSGTGRVYMKDCYIEGSVDFIFGRDIILFDSCELHINRNQCSITAASTDADSKFGFVFRDCIISYDSIGFDGNAVNQIFLGRAWQAAPRTVFMNTFEPGVIDSLGWNQQPINSGIIPALYGVYQNYGPGYNENGHAQGIGSILSSVEAADYTKENIFSKDSNPAFGFDWIPTNPVTSVNEDYSSTQIPQTFQLYQNFPNPFNPSTTIRYDIPNSGIVKIKIYNILGNYIRTLIHQYQTAGSYSMNICISDLPSGVYIYRIISNSFSSAKKLILLK